MLDFLLSRGFLPHGYCMQWRSDLLWLHVWSDVGIALAYFSIPIMLIYFLQRRTASTEVPAVYVLVGVMFAAFILFCGLTHLMGLVTIWKPYYGAQGVIKAATAFISIATAVTMVPLLPRALSLRTPESMESDLNRLHGALQRSEAEKADLEREVAELRRRLRENGGALAQS